MEFEKGLMRLWVVECLTCSPRAKELVEEQEVEGDLSFPLHDSLWGVMASKYGVLVSIAVVFSVAFLHIQ